MQRQAFIVWSSALGVGIAASAFFAVPFVALFPTFLALILLLLLAHRCRRAPLFVLTSCLFFFLVGLARGLQGDVSLLPQSVYHSAARVSSLLVARLHSLGLSPDVTSLLDAMLVGQRQALPHTLRQLYADVGASHVLALSGLHLGILFGVFDYCLMRALTLAPVRCALGVFGLLTLWMYALVAGLPVSLVRASIMLSLFILSQMRLSGTDSWHTLGIAAMLILFVSPSSLWSVGFQLSFAAMAGLFLFYSPLRHLWQTDCRLLRWLWSGVVASFSAQVLGIPLVVYYFRQLSLYSILLSPFYILLSTLILYSGLLALLFGSGFAFLSSFFVGLQLRLFHCVALLPGSVFVVLHSSLAQVVLQYIGLFCFIPLLRGLQPQYGVLRYQRLAYVLRRWPYILASIICFLIAYFV